MGIHIFYFWDALYFTTSRLHCTYYIYMITYSILHSSFFDDANKFLRQWSTIGLESFIILFLMKLTTFHQKILHAFNTPKLPLLLFQKREKQYIEYVIM